MSEVVQSVNIMLAILLVGVCVTIYWIFKYDEWYPNDIVSNVSNEHGSDDSGIQGLEIPTE